MAEQKAKAPLRVTITGAAGQIGYSLIPHVASGNVFGPDQPVILHLLDIERAATALKGVAMEIEDCAYPLVHGIVPTTDLKEGFTGTNVAILVGGMPRQKGQERKDLLAANGPIFKGQGNAINEFADRNCKVIVVANPCNTNCLIAMRHAPSIPPQNFTALTRLDMNRAKGQLALKLKTTTEHIKNVTIWGNHSKTMCPDADHALLGQAPLKDSLDQEWLAKEFVPIVQERGAAVIATRGLSSAMSAAHAVADHLRDWFRGTKPGEYVSMAIVSDGSYGVEKGIIYSFPVTCEAGTYKIVQGLELSEATQAQMKVTEKELVEERDEIISLGL